MKTSTEPQTNGERQYVSFETLATRAAAEGNDPLALTYWREMARLSSPTTGTTGNGTSWP